MTKVTEYPCDLCGSNEAVEVPYARLYTNDEPIHICRSCGFVYVKYRRSSDEIAKSWSEEIFGGNYTARIPAVKARQTYVADFIDVNLGLKGKELCDIGGGEGQFLQMARDDYDANIFAIEPSQKNCEKLEEMGIESFNGTIENYTKEKGTNERADIVTIMWTLENCLSCRDMLSAAYNLTAEDGHIMVATGSRILVPFKKPLDLYFSKNPLDTHCFRFSANSLKGLLAVAGFDVVHVNSYIDSDVMCMIAKKRKKGTEITWEKDDYMKVHNFFERWHQESVYYR